MPARQCQLRLITYRACPAQAQKAAAQRIIRTAKIAMARSEGSQFIALQHIAPAALLGNFLQSQIASPRSHKANSHHDDHHRERDK